MNTIADIKNTIVSDFMNNETIADAYGFTKGDAFDNTFSKVSIESLIFYIVASAIYVAEALFDQHKEDVEARIDEIIPHRPKWYRDKVLTFMKGYTLVTDCDYYDTSSLSESEISAAKVVKYATATENKDMSILTIKVAGEESGERISLDADTQTQLAAYIDEIKDAGVRYNLVNKDADVFNCTINIMYDAQLLQSEIEDNVRAAIKNYIENLPFNGEYTNMSLIDAVQKISGVKVAEVKNSEAQVSGEKTVTSINMRYTPSAGYFKIGNLIINMSVYEEDI